MKKKQITLQDAMQLAESIEMTEKANGMVGTPESRRRCEEGRRDQGNGPFKGTIQRTSRGTEDENGVLVVDQNTKSEYSLLSQGSVSSAVIENIQQETSKKGTNRKGL